MNGTEQNPNVWTYEAALQQAFSEQQLRISPERADESLQRCVGCVAARSSQISAGTLSLCGDLTMRAAQGAFERDQQSDEPLTQQPSPGLYQPTAAAQERAHIPKDCYTLLPDDQKTERDIRTISQRYLDIGILACIGCIVSRNNGVVPDTIFTSTMFTLCQMEKLPTTGSALKRIAALPDSPLRRITSSTSSPRFVLTEAAKKYATASNPPGQCDQIVGLPPKTQRSQPTSRAKKVAAPSLPSPVKLTKTVKQVQAASVKQRALAAQKIKAETPVNLEKTTIRAPKRARHKVIDALVATCLNCIATRNLDYSDLPISGRAVASCIHTYHGVVLASFARLAAKQNAPIYKKPDSRSSYNLAPGAKQNNMPNTLPNCTSIAAELSQPAKKRGQGKLWRTTGAARPTIQESVIQRYVQQIEDQQTREQLAGRLRNLVDHEALVISPVSGGIAAANDECELVISDKLDGITTPATQRAFFYALGIDHLIYDEPVHEERLRAELRLLPRDSVRAVGNLVGYKLLHQKPPFEYIGAVDEVND